MPPRNRNFESRSDQANGAPLVLAFSDARLAVPEVREASHLILGVEATIELTVNGRTIFTEPGFPIVELRLALTRWRPASGDFEFESVESDEDGMVWFRKQRSGTWKAGSIWQDEAARGELTEDQVLQACDAFIAAVDRWVENSLSLNVDEVLNRRR